MTPQQRDIAQERWGGFVLVADQVTPTVTRTPAPVDVGSDEEAIPFAYPGYRRFDSIEALSQFVANRAPVRKPSSLPSDATLLGAYAVELPDKRISDAAIGYRTTNQDAILEDPDIWIAVSYRFAIPLVYSTDSATLGRGQIQEGAQKVTAAQHPAVYLPTTNPPGLPRALQFASAVSWFEEDGSFWTVQGKNLDEATLLKIADGLLPVP